MSCQINLSFVVCGKSIMQLSREYYKHDHFWSIDKEIYFEKEGEVFALYSGLNNRI